MELSIIIVNFNGAHFLAECLDSIRQCVRVPNEVIVVDNASTDGSVEYLRSVAGIKLIEAGKNLGFAAGNNLGVRSATGRHLLLLNNDTILLDDIGPALDLLEANSSIGLVGVRMLGRDQEHRISAGHFPAPWRLIRFSWLHCKSSGLGDGRFSSPSRPIRVDWVEGSFMLLRTADWNSLGGLDEEYFMYVEDVDLARRVLNTGRQVVYLPSIRYIHFGGYSHPRLGMLVGGYRRFHKKHSGLATQIAVNAVLDLGMLLRALFCVAKAVIDRSALSSAAVYFAALRQRE